MAEGSGLRAQGWPGGREEGTGAGSSRGLLLKVLMRTAREATWQWMLKLRFHTVTESCVLVKKQEAVSKSINFIF